MSKAPTSILPIALILATSSLACNLASAIQTPDNNQQASLNQPAEESQIVIATESLPEPSPTPATPTWTSSPMPTETATPTATQPPPTATATYPPGHYYWNNLDAPDMQDFSSSAGENWVSEVSDGELYLHWDGQDDVARILQQKFVRLDEEDMVVNVYARFVSGDGEYSAGVFCRIEPSSVSGYGFFVSPQGAYRITRMVNGEGTMLMHGTTDVVRAQDWNNLHAWCQGPSLGFAVNGQKLAVIEDTTFTHGNFAVAMRAAPGTTQASVSFDKIAVAEP